MSNYTDDFSRASTGDDGFTNRNAEWSVGIQRGGLPDNAYSMIEAFCAHCKAGVGKVGLPMKRGASMIEVQFRCAECGEITWWRSANPAT